MKIERDKFYRTKEGRKARVICTDAGYGAQTVIALVGGVTEGELGWIVRLYADGRDPGSTKEFDLIAEWIDKPEVDWSKMAAWHRWVAMDRSEEWNAFDAMPTRLTEEWGITNVGYPTWSRIPPEFAPKWSGDWRESLCERPLELDDPGPVDGSGSGFRKL